MSWYFNKLNHDIGPENSRCSRGLEEDSWLQDSLEGAPSALLNMLPIKEEICLPGRETECLTDFQYGTMCEHSTGTLGGDELTYLAADSHAKESLPPGLKHEESALWHHQARIIREVEPARVELENGAMLNRRGIEKVLWDLAAMGFDACWGVLGAYTFGAPHERKRTWIVAAHPDRPQREGRKLPSGAGQEYSDIGRCTWWKDKPGICGVDDGMANRVDRLIAIGNGQVPAVAAFAWRTLIPHPEARA